MEIIILHSSKSSLLVQHFCVILCFMFSFLNEHPPVQSLAVVTDSLSFCFDSLTVLAYDTQLSVFFDTCMLVTVPEITL